MKKSLFSISSWNKYNLPLMGVAFILMLIGSVLYKLVGLAIGSLIGLCLILMYKCICLENYIIESHVQGPK